MTRIILMTAGGLLSLSGAVLTLTPIPGSTLALTSGLALILCSSPFASRCLQLLRTRFHLFNSGMAWIENRAGGRIGGALKQTRPHLSGNTGVDNSP